MDPGGEEKTRQKLDYRRIAVVTVLCLSAITAFGVSIANHETRMQQKTVLKLDPSVDPNNPQPQQYYVSGGGAAGYMRYY